MILGTKVRTKDPLWKLYCSYFCLAPSHYLFHLSLQYGLYIFGFVTHTNITFIFLGEKSASFKSSNMFEKVHSTLLFHGIYTNLLCKVRKAQLLIWIVVPDTFFWLIFCSSEIQAWTNYQRNFSNRFFTVLLRTSFRHIIFFFNIIIAIFPYRTRFIFFIHSEMVLIETPKVLVDII